jgi:hypothetical protein
VEHVERDVDRQQDIAVRPATIIAIMNDLRGTGASFLRVVSLTSEQRERLGV